MKMRYIIYLFILVYLVGSCKKEATNPYFDDKPVVAAYLKEGDTARLNISRLSPFASNTTYSADDINALQIAMQVNDTGTYTLTALGNGNYKASNPLLKIKQGFQYSLRFNYNGKVVSASTTIPTKPTGFTLSVPSFSLTQITPTTPASSYSLLPDPLQITWANNDNSYYMILVENIETSPVLINTTTDGPVRTFRNAPVQTNTYQVRPGQFHYFGWHRIILYHLNADYAALYSASNNNSNNLADSPSGISNGAGIFTGMNSDTLLFKVVKLQ